MPETGRVTLAIPCFNGERFIGPALEAVSRLDPAPHEVIVVDDGSTDGSARVVARFPGVRLLSHRENRGIAEARDTALAQARGEIIVFVDADAGPCPSLIARLQEGFTDEKVAGVGGRALEVHRTDPPDRWRAEVLFQDWGERSLPSVPFLFGVCSAWRVDLLRREGGFDPAFRTSGEDMDLSFRLRRAGFRLAYRAQAVVEHRRRDTADTLAQMTYRHCLWGFVAQRKNKMWKQKVPLLAGLAVLLRQLLVDGIVRRDPAFARLTLRLHRIVMLAWFDSRRLARGAPLSRYGALNCTAWEGHGAPPSP